MSETEQGTDLEVIEGDGQEKAPIVLSLAEKLKAISEAKDGEMINSQRARQIRMEFGISQGYFTKKQLSKDARKTKRKMQKESRKVNRKDSRRGLKQSGR